MGTPWSSSRETVNRGIGGATRRSYPAEHRALRTETVIDDTADFGIGKRLTNLPALREIGTHANRRLLRVQSLGTTRSPAPTPSIPSPPR